MFNSIFGSAAQAYAAQQMFGSSARGSQQGLANQMNASAAQQQAAQAYNAAMMQNRTRWMINGVSYPNAKEFAKALFPGDDQARLMFALKYGEE
jgi:hypothetical protein